MPSPVRVSSVAVAKPRRSTTGESASDADRLRTLLDNGKIPNYVKLVVELLMETREEVKVLNRRNAELLEEIKSLREENSFLKEELMKARSLASYHTENGRIAGQSEDSEHKRSIVLSNVVESSAASSLARNAHDFDCVFKILDFLGVECKPVAVYRMGRLQQNRPRLVKVVLPASRFQADAVRRTPRLRFFPFQKGIYLRPSLTREERESRRQERLSKRGLTSDGTRGATQTPCVQRIPPSQQSISNGSLSPHLSSPSGNY